MADGINAPLKSLQAIKWNQTADFWMRRRVNAFKCGGESGGRIKKKRC